ncbi:MAG: hypothetical protein IPH13_07745 [Planctomycetes bacterium]|nr:hypothetical protein [Planctomycetota bacterium]MCC7172984.1 hypothetical protein [Planctomycetota bacterium]
MVDSTQPVAAASTVEDVAHKPRHQNARPHAFAIHARPHDALVLSDHARHDLIARTLRTQGVIGAELALPLSETELRRWGKLEFHDVLEECDEVSAPAIANTILEAIVGYLLTAWNAQHDAVRAEPAEFVAAVEFGVVRGLDAAVETLADFGIAGADVDRPRDEVEGRVRADLRAVLGSPSDRP